MFYVTIHSEKNEIPMPTTLAWVSKGLEKYLEQDEYGVYKKADVKIPWFYKLEYNLNKRHRKFMINYYFKKLENLTESDIIEREKLLRME